MTGETNGLGGLREILAAEASREGRISRQGIKQTGLFSRGRAHQAFPVSGKPALQSLLAVLVRMSAERGPFELEDLLDPRGAKGILNDTEWQRRARAALEGISTHLLRRAEPAEVARVLSGVDAPAEDPGGVHGGALEPMTRVAFSGDPKVAAVARFWDAPLHLDGGTTTVFEALAEAPWAPPQAAKAVVSALGALSGGKSSVHELQGAAAERLARGSGERAPAKQVLIPTAEGDYRALTPAPSVAVQECLETALTQSPELAEAIGTRQRLEGGKNPINVSDCHGDQGGWMSALYAAVPAVAGFDERRLRARRLERGEPLVQAAGIDPEPLAERAEHFRARLTYASRVWLYCTELFAALNALCDEVAVGETEALEALDQLGEREQLYVLGEIDEAQADAWAETILREAQATLLSRRERGERVAIISHEGHRLARGVITRYIEAQQGYV